MITRYHSGWFVLYLDWSETVFLVGVEFFWQGKFTVFMRYVFMRYALGLFFSLDYFCL